MVHGDGSEYSGAECNTTSISAAVDDKVVMGLANEILLVIAIVVCRGRGYMDMLVSACTGLWLHHYAIDTRVLGSSGGASNHGDVSEGVD